MIQVNSSYNEESVKKTLDKCIKSFYDSMISKVESLTLLTLTKKNPYLFKIKGFNRASDIVNSAMSAYISSSEETVFGNSFFEPLAKEVCSGNKALAEGIDVMVEKEEEIYALAIKSGPKVFNSDSRKRQMQNFAKASTLAKQAKKRFLPIIGYCYGRKEQKPGATVDELAGQQFWFAVTGDEDFYKKILIWCDGIPEKYLPRYQDACDRANNRLLKEFSDIYCDDQGNIRWDSLAEICSGSKPKRKSKSKPKL